MRRALAEFQKKGEGTAVEKQTLELKCEALRDEVDSSVRQLEAAKTSLLIAEQKLEFCEKQLAKCKGLLATYEDAEPDNDAKAKQVSKLTKMCTEYQQQSERLQVQVSELTKIMSKQNGDVDMAADLSADNASLRKQLDTLKCKAGSLSSSNGSLQSDLEIAQARLARLQDDAKHAEGRRGVSSDEISALTKQLARAKCAARGRGSAREE